MSLQIRNYLNKKAYFWKLVRFYKNSIQFPFFKNAYGVKSFYREERISERILQRSIVSVVFNIGYAALFIFLFEHLYKVSPYKTSFHLDDQSINDLLQTIVTVTGVFLGLYFTAVSAVAGNLFMQAPNNLQRLFLRERKGKQYIRTLAITTIIGVGYLLLQVFKYSVSPIGPVVVAILAVYGIVRFLSLGSQTFYFLHPSETTNTIASDIISNINSATVNGFGWKKDFLQNHSRKQAESSFEVMQSLIRFAKEKMNLSSEQMVEIAKYAGGLFNYYLEKKSQIPSTSFWYKTKREFQNWILADASELTIALNSGTPLSPKEVKDKNWFEGKCLDIVLEIFDGLVKQKKWEDALGCLEIILVSFESIGSELCADIGKMVLKRVNEVLEPVIASGYEKLTAEDKRGLLAMVDAQGRFAVAILISLVRHIDKYVDPKNFSLKVQRIDWQSKNAAYQADLPGVLTEKIEKSSTQYQQERLIEGHFVSPEWYRLTIVAQQYLLDLKKYYEFAKSADNDLFRRNVDVLIGRKEYLLAAQLMQRWLEFSTKLAVCKVRLEKLVGNYKVFHQVHDLPWIELDFNEEKKIIESWDKEAIDRMTRLIPDLIHVIPSQADSLPDYFGQAYTFGVEACYQACFDNDAERFLKIFPAVFLGSLAAFDTTRDKVKGWAQESQIIFPSEALEDVLHLSGFVKLYSELYKNEALWQHCEGVWTRYLGSSKAKDIIQLIAATTQYRDAQLGTIMPKAELRMNWAMKFQAKINELGLVIEPFTGTLGESRERVNHDSPLIRLIAREGDFPFFDARDLFFVTYLSKHEAARDIQFSDRRGLGDQLDREVQSSNDEHNE